MTVQTVFYLSQSRRLPLLQVVSNNKSFSVGVQSPTEINAPRGCAVILRRICQLSLTRITHQVSRAFDLNVLIYRGMRHPTSDIQKRNIRFFIDRISLFTHYDYFYILFPYCCFGSLKELFSATIRLNTGAPSLESLTSAQK